MILGLSGKKQSGKNTVAKIINYLIAKNEKDSIDCTFQQALQYWNDGLQGNKQWKFQEKQFADKLKDIVCLLINYTREQLEDESFKSSKLNSDWNNSHGIDTVRQLLQVVGTDCGRDMIHPDLWINALMNEYKGYFSPTKGTVNNYEEAKLYNQLIYPNWVITDVRFPNEAKAIKDKGGVVIRVNRSLNITSDRVMAMSIALYADRKINNPDLHESETALDNYEGFDYIIHNNSSIEELIESVKKVLEHLKII